MELSTEQQKKFKRLQLIKAKGLVGILELLEEIELKLDKELPKVTEIMARVKGDKGDSPDDKKLISLITPLIPKVENGRTPTAKEITELIKPLIPKLEDKKPVQNVPVPSAQEVAKVAADIVSEKIKDSIPTIEDISNEIPKLGERIRDALELLNGDERLDISAIKGLKELLRKIEKSIGSSSGQPNTVAMSRQNLIAYYDLTDQTDGTTKSFNIPGHYQVLEVKSSQFPITYRPLVDWTVDGTVLTLTDEVSAPETGQTLYIIYIQA